MVDEVEFPNSPESMRKGLPSTTRREMSPSLINAGFWAKTGIEEKKRKRPSERGPESFIMGDLENR
jgi:hypothetical protein